MCMKSILNPHAAVYISFKKVEGGTSSLSIKTNYWNYEIHNRGFTCVFMLHSVFNLTLLLAVFALRSSKFSPSQQFEIDDSVLLVV